MGIHKSKWDYDFFSNLALSSFLIKCGFNHMLKVPLDWTAMMEGAHSNHAMIPCPNRKGDEAP